MSRREFSIVDFALGFGKIACGLAFKLLCVDGYVDLSFFQVTELFGRYET